MATAAQRRWAASHRAAAAKDPARYAPIRIKSSVDRKAEAKAEPAWRAAAREGAAVKSYMRAGMTESEAKAAAGIKAAKAKEPIGIGVMPVKKFKPEDLKPPALDPLSGKPLVAAVHAKPTPPGIHVRPPTDIQVERETFWEALKGKSGEIRKYEIDPLEKKVRREQLGLIAQASRISRYNAQLNIYENRLNKYPISDGVFTGSEKEYERYKKDYGKYIGKFKQVNTETDAYNKQVGVTESKRTKLAGLELKSQRARFGGLAGKYEEAERIAAEKLPSLKDVEKMGAKFRETHPETAKKIYKSFQAAHEVTQMELKGTVPYSGTLYKPIIEGEITPQEVSTKVFMRDIDRARLAGVMFEPKKFVKAVVTTAAWVAVPPAIKGVAILGKAIGAGARVKRAAQLTGVGMGAMYTHQVGAEIRSAERISIKAEEERLGRPLTRYERETVGGYAQGAVFGDVIFTEVLPMFAGGYIGTKAVEAVPKFKPAIKKVIDLPVKEFNKQMRAIEIIREIGMVGVPKLKAKPKVKPKPKLVVKKVPKTAEQKKLEKLIIKAEAKKGAPLLESEVAALKRSLEIPKTPEEVMFEMKVEAMVKQIDDIVRFRNQHLRIFVVGKQEPTMKQMMKAISTGKKPKLYEPLLKQELKTAAQIRTAKQELRLLLDRKVITKAEYKQVLKLIEKQEAIAIPKPKVKTISTTAFTTQITSIAGVMQIFKTISVTKPAVITKAIEIAAQKEKLRMALLEIPALTYKQAISSISAITSVAKAITEAKPAKKYIPPRVPKKPKVKKVKIIPLVTPIIKLPKKKKRVVKKKPKVIVGYTPYEIRSRIATLHEMFG